MYNLCAYRRCIVEVQLNETLCCDKKEKVNFRLFFYFISPVQFIILLPCQNMQLVRIAEKGRIMA